MVPRTIFSTYEMTAEMIYHGCVRAFGRMLSYETSVIVSTATEETSSTFL